MLRRRLGILFVAALGCSKEPAGDGSVRPGQPGPPRSAAPASAAPTPPPRSVVRDVPFDGGTARIEVDARGLERVLLLNADGGIVGESSCAAMAGFDAVRAFFTDVQVAILDKQSDRAADKMAFPLRINGKDARQVTSREQFLRERERIITPGVFENVRAADPRKVFCNAQGAMFAEGLLWADVQPNGRLAVYAVDVGGEPVKKK